MAAKGYTNQTEIEGYMLQDIDPTYATQLDSFIEAVENHIEKQTNRVFIADSTASARLYDGDGTPELLIDECVAITNVEVGSDHYGGAFTEIASTGSERYFTEPANAIARGMAIFKLYLNATIFTSGIQNNRITAKWGFSTAVPADIKFVTTVFVAGILNQTRGAGGDIIKSERIGNYTVTFNNDQRDTLADFERAQDILHSYKRLLL